MILGIAENFNKARYAIPHLRVVLSDIITKSNEIKAAMKDATDEEERRNLEIALTEAMKFDTRLHEIMDALLREMTLTAKTGGLSANDFREKMSRITRKTSAPDKMLGYVYNLPTGGVLTISVSDVRTLNALLTLNSRLVDWHQGTPEEMAREASRRLLLANQPDDIREILQGMRDGSKK